MTTATNKLKDKYLVKKRNILNQMRDGNMTLQEHRFFCIYLSKINPNDISTRVVRFSISDFKAVMELGRINIDYLNKVTRSLLSKVVSVPDFNEDGEFIGYTAFQLFKKCKVRIDGSDPYIEIDAHDDALPLMFDYKNRYFSYQIGNILRLRSFNQLRMYELLKQYYTIGEKIYCIEDLRNDLGIGRNEYSSYNNFKVRVLQSCQKALAEKTDLKFTFEPWGKRGKSGKILFLKFYIMKNDSYKDQITLDQFILSGSSFTADSLLITP